ncbi:MAG TPA: hypothetical protein VHZ97_01240 [Pseudonocardiaceae bacterium]|jgi:hypothetical protein|nr:hypothetical protein [Pseudonocardiaceae bacterium]
MSKETRQNPETKPVQPTGKRSGQVRLSQLLATALAAVTAAFLGSRLGVAGTVTGAGVASVVSTIGTALYQNSLERTTRAARKVRSHVVARTGRPIESPVTAPVADRPLVVDQPTTEVTGAWAPTRQFEPIRKPDPIADATTEWLSRPTELFTRPTEVADRPSGVYQRPADAPTELVGPPGETRRRPRWRMLIGATALAFVLGMGVVTGIELLVHRPFSGGDTGTTISGLFGGPTEKPTSTHPKTPATSTTTRDTPTTTPTAPSSDTPTGTPTPTTTPSPSSTTPPTSTTTAPTTTTTTTTGKQGAP